MPCPISITKFVGTVSLGLLTGVSYASAGITIPALKALPTASHATKALEVVKKRSRKIVLITSEITNKSFFLAWYVASRRKKHPYLIWVSLATALGTWGVDYWFHRELGLVGWLRSIEDDIGLLQYFNTKLSISKSSTASSGSATPGSPRKDDDLVVVEADFNGETIEQALDRESRHNLVRFWFSLSTLTMAIVGLWGDGA